MMSKYLALCSVTDSLGKYLFSTGSSFSVRASYAVRRRCSFSGVILTNGTTVSVKFSTNRCLQNGAYPSLSLLLSYSSLMRCSNWCLSKLMKELFVGSNCLKQKGSVCLVVNTHDDLSNCLHMYVFKEIFNVA